MNTDEHAAAAKGELTMQQANEQVAGLKAPLREAIRLATIVRERLTRVVKPKALTSQ
jgi:hypothetical protein